MWNSNSTSVVRRLGYDSVVGTDAATVLSDGLALPEEERARVAAELFASLESRDPEYSAERALAWARTVEERIERFARGESQGVDLDAARQRVDTALADT
jgi:hypothetical protein